MTTRVYDMTNTGVNCVTATMDGIVPGMDIVQHPGSHNVPIVECGKTNTTNYGFVWIDTGRDATPTLDAQRRLIAARAYNYAPSEKYPRYRFAKPREEAMTEWYVKIIVPFPAMGRYNPQIVGRRPHSPLVICHGTRYLSDTLATREILVQMRADSRTVVANTIGRAKLLTIKDGMPDFGDTAQLREYLETIGSPFTRYLLRKLAPA